MESAQAADDMKLHDPDFDLVFDDALTVDIEQSEHAAYWATLLEAEVREIAYAVSRVGRAPNAVEMAVVLTRELGQSAFGPH